MSEDQSRVNQQSKQGKSQISNKEEMRSRRSSKARLTEDDLPENYAELAKRVYIMAEKEGWSKEKVFELLQDPQKLVKKMEHRNIDGFEKPLDPVVQRMLEDQQKREVKRQQLVEQQQKASEESGIQMKSQKQSRTHDEFMADQVRFEQKRYERLKEVIQQEETEESKMFKPQVSKGTQKILKKKEQDSKKVHDRLFQQKEIKGASVKFQDDKDFQPNINKKSKQIKREQDIIQYLTVDSQRRQDKKKLSEVTKEEQETIPKEKRIKQLSEKNKKMLYQKLDVMYNHFLVAQDCDEDSMIDEEQTKNVLYNLGMVNDSVNSLFGDLFVILAKSEDKIKAYNLKVAICAILNFNFDWMKNQDCDRKFDQNHIGEFDDDGNFTLTDQEIDWIQKRFFMMHQLRQDYIHSHTKSRCPGCLNCYETPEFRPQTCKNSQKFHKKNEGSYHDHLIQRGLQYKEKREKLIEESKHKETNGCSFKPKVLNKKIANKEEISSNKWEQLFQLAERKKGRTDRNVDEIEIEKNPDLYTFQPKRDKKRRNSPEPRRREERKEERKETQKRDRSVPQKVDRRKLKKKVKDYEVYEDKKEDEEPLLLVDINLGPQKQFRIALFKDSNPKFVGEKFSEDKKLDKVQTDNLIQMLENQFKNAVKTKK